MTDLRIIFVDDNPTERELAREAFAEFAPDLELTTLGSREELFAALDGDVLPHLVLLDLHLGRDTGDDIARQLQGHAAHMVPVVILTNTNDEHDRSRCFAAGAVDFWIKPMHFSGYPQLLDQARQLASLFRQSGLQRCPPPKD